MNVDPLGDTVPARHAIESDEEEDEYNPLSLSKSEKTPVAVIDIKITIENVRKGQALVIATGHAGRFWAQGASLGEQSGTVMLNRIQVGLLFQPSWITGTVLVSEVTTKLPVSTMYRYAKCVLDAFEPSSLALLDSYPMSSYMSPDTMHNAPVRYLCVDALPPKTAAQPYSPPNLIQSTTASFLNVFHVHRRSLLGPPGQPCIAVLLPSSHLCSPPPKELKATNTGFFADADSEEWPSQIMNLAQESLFSIDIIMGEPAMKWETKGGRERGLHAFVRQKSEIGEAGMYI